MKFAKKEYYSCKTLTSYTILKTGNSTMEQIKPHFKNYILMTKFRLFNNIITCHNKKECIDDIKPTKMTFFLAQAMHSIPPGSKSVNALLETMHPQ